MKDGVLPLGFSLSWQRRDQYTMGANKQAHMVPTVNRSMRVSTAFVTRSILLAAAAAAAPPGGCTKELLVIPHLSDPQSWVTVLLDLTSARVEVY